MKNINKKYDNFINVDEEIEAQKDNNNVDEFEIFIP